MRLRLRLRLRLGLGLGLGCQGLLYQRFWKAIHLKDLVEVIYCFFLLCGMADVVCPVPHAIRLGEHRQAVKRGDQKNGIAVHVHNTQHCIDWKGSKIRRRAAGYWERRTTEAIQIRKTSPNMNLDSGLLLPMVWNPIETSTKIILTHYSLSCIIALFY